MPFDCDCLIVGGGAVGATAALALAAAGRTVVLVEQQAQTPAGDDPDVRALVLAPASVRVLEQVGVWPRLAPRSTPIRHIHVSERGRYGVARLSADEVGLAALGWACPADALLAELRKAAAACLGPGWRPATRYLGHAATADSVEVALESAGAPAQVRTRVVIGADGAGSAVRAAAGIACAETAYGQQAIVAMLEVAAPRPGWAYERFTRRGPLAFIPCGGARYVSVQCLDDAAAAPALAATDADYLALLTRRFGRRLGELSALGPRRAHALVRRRAQAVCAARVMLAGNAANTVHPNAAQGLNLGLRDVAGLLHASGGAADAGAPAVLAEYAACRARDQRSIGAATDFLARWYRSPLGLAACGRQAALVAVAGLPPLRRALIEHASGLAALARMTRG